MQYIQNYEIMLYAYNMVVSVHYGYLRKFYGIYMIMILPKFLIYFVIIYK